MVLETRIKKISEEDTCHRYTDKIKLKTNKQTAQARRVTLNPEKFLTCSLYGTVHKEEILLSFMGKRAA